MSAADSVSPPSATPSAQPQSQHLFPPPPPPPTSAPISTPTSSAPSIQPQQQQQQPPLPPPQTFDILPPLHALLSRLEPSLNTYTTDPISTFAANKSSTNASFASNNNNGSNSNGSFSQTTTAAAGQQQQQQQQQGQLSYKDVATASQFLKARMRKALVELGKLGDMERGLEEQEEEIRDLEERIMGQKGVLSGLAAKARTAELGGAAGDAVKEGSERGQRTMG